MSVSRHANLFTKEDTWHVSDMPDGEDGEMPYRTKSGSHYHMTKGCHRATILCGTEGLTPCSTCCGGGAGRSSGSPVASGGTPAGIGGGGTSLSGSQGEFASQNGAKPSEDSFATSVKAVLSQTQAKAGMGASQAPEVSITPDALAQSMSQQQEDASSQESEFSKIPMLPTIGQLRMRGRVELVRDGKYTLHVRDYEGSKRINYVFSVASKSGPLRGRLGEYVRIDWKNDYWDTSGYGFVRVDGDDEMTIDSSFSFNDYEAKKLVGSLREAGMSDADFAQIIRRATGKEPASQAVPARGATSVKPSKQARSGSGRGKIKKLSPKAIQAGDVFFMQLNDSGFDVEDDEALRKAFDEAIRTRQIDVPEDSQGVAWASVLDARERELGWD